MWETITSFIKAVIIHLCFLGILIYSIQLPYSSSTAPIAELPTQLVDETAILAEVERLKREEEIRITQQRAEKYTLEVKKIEQEQTILEHQEQVNRLHEQRQLEKQELEAIKQELQQEEEKAKAIKRERAKAK